MMARTACLTWPHVAISSRKKIQLASSLKNKNVYLLNENVGGAYKLTVSSNMAKGIKALKKRQEDTGRETAGDSEIYPFESDVLSEKMTQVRKINMEAQEFKTSEGSTRKIIIASRDQVLSACVTTSFTMALIGIILREGSHLAQLSGWQIPDLHHTLPLTFSLDNLTIILESIFAVTLARLALLQWWKEFGVASDKSNTQVLTNLGPGDIVLISICAGVSEELLFRGAVLPLVHPDWIGVSASGLIFGILHVTGDRNTAFAFWATIVGIGYGFIALQSGDLAVPIIVHSAANVVSASLWKLKFSDK